MCPVLYSVRQRVKENDDTFTLELEPDAGELVPGFRAGQFNMLYVFGVGEIPISISGDPSKPYRLIHTTRAVGTVTRAMSELREDDVIGVRGPFGTHWPMERIAGNDVVIVDGRHRPGARCARRSTSCSPTASKFGRIVLLYGARTPEDMLYRRELEQWRPRFDLEVHVTVDRATGDWRGNVGVVTTLIRACAVRPAGLGGACLRAGGDDALHRPGAERRGVPSDRIYVSMERNMKCGVGFCGHCQFGPIFVCKDGPVFRFDQVERIFRQAGGVT